MTSGGSENHNYFDVEPDDVLLLSKWAKEGSVGVSTEVSDALGRVIAACTLELEAQAYKFRAVPRLERDDLIQEGIFGIYDAFRTFNEEKGDPRKFPQISSRRIFGRMFVFSAMSGGAISRTEAQLKSFGTALEIQQAFEVLTVEDRLLPGALEALLEEHAFSAQQFKRAMLLDRYTNAVAIDVLDLAYLKAEDIGQTAIEQGSRTLQVPEGADPPDVLVAQEQLDLLRRALSKLLPRERHVIDALIGLTTEPRTGNEVAEELGITKGRVSQIKHIALQKLRQALDVEEADVSIDQQG